MRVSDEGMSLREGLIRWAILLGLLFAVGECVPSRPVTLDPWDDGYGTEW